MATRPVARQILKLLAMLCGAIASLLGVRFLLRLLLANPANPVTSFVSTLTRPLLFPWDHLWPPTPLPIATVERAALAGLVCYAAVGLVLAFLGQATTRSKEPV